MLVMTMRSSIARFVLVALLWMVSSVMAETLPVPVTQALKAAGIPLNAVSLVVRDVDSTSPRVSFGSNQLMNPASVIKLLTTYAALDLLGPAYAWQTEVLVGETLVDGVLKGDLYIRGGGDPKFTYEQLWRLLRQVRQRGIKEINGDLVLDRSAFQVPEVDTGAFDDQPMRPYNVLPDALLLNFNAVSLRLMPDSASATLGVGSEPVLSNLEIVNRLVLGKQSRCADWRDSLRADAFPKANGTRLVLTGTYPLSCGDQTWNISPGVPQRYFLGVFQALWIELGGSFSGEVRAGVVPTNARLIADMSSPSLAEVVRDINKYSNNVMARQLYLTLGLSSGRRPVRDEDAEAVVRNWLRTRNLDKPGLVLDNGSGLSRQTRISAAHMAQILQSAWNSAVMPELMASLPLTAMDGTMKKRLKQQGVAGQAHIKTGSLEGVRAIAGYVLDRAGRRSIVVFLINHTNAAAARPAQDALLQWMYERGE
jgi:D-alanyl-D-alanine carboxypeptidase/D-alanyl-D-alanine-endopeptidase (penicillin-binding protein 4)